MILAAVMEVLFRFDQSVLLVLFIIYTWAFQQSDSTCAHKILIIKLLDGLLQKSAERGGSEFFFIVNIQVSFDSSFCKVISLLSSSKPDLSVHIDELGARNNHVYLGVLLHDKNSSGGNSFATWLCQWRWFL